MIIGRHIGFTRWYDRTAELSQAVRTMEKLAPAYQRMISEAIVGLMEIHELSQGEELGVKHLGVEKVLALMKSKGRRRWYDQDLVTHKAFNLLYLMDDATQHEMAIKMLVTIRALEELRAKQKSLKECHEMVQGIFNRRMMDLLDKVQLVTKDSPKKEAMSMRFYAPPEPRPSSEPEPELELELEPELERERGLSPSSNALPAAGHPVNQPVGISDDGALVQERRGA